MSLLNLVTRGHLDDSSPLSVATRGHLNFDVAIEDVKLVVVEETTRQSSPGGIGVNVGPVPSYQRYVLQDRAIEEKRDINDDDDEVLELLITMFTGIVD